MQTDSAERPYLPPIAAAADQKVGGKRRSLDVRKGNLQALLMQ